MSIKYTLRKNAFKAYAYLKYPLPLWKLFNMKSVRAFQGQSKLLDEVQKRIVQDLQETGIAVTNLTELFGDPALITKLQNDAQRRKDNGSVNHKKKFLIDFWSENPELTSDNIFLQLALDPRIIDVANTYMGMWTSLLYFTLQETIPAQTELSNSQNWHRDPQEQKIVKVFCYLNDVDLDTGPFTYVKHSAPTQHHQYAKLFPQQLPAGSYPGNEKVEQAVSQDDITPMVGKAGTVIFCDTNGLHYGGVAMKKPRIMTTFGYAAHTYRENQTYHYAQELLEKLKDLPPQSRHAIRPKWRQTPDGQ